MDFRCNCNFLSKGSQGPNPTYIMRMEHKNQKEPYIPSKEQMPIFPLVNAVLGVLRRNPKLLLRAGLFPFLLLFIIGLWTTPESWGSAGYYAIRGLELVLVVCLWTFYTMQLQRFVLKGPIEGAASYLPKLNKTELRYGLVSFIILTPFSAFAIWYDQPLFFHQPDLLIMGGMTAMDGAGQLLYTSLFAGWIVQIYAFVLPAIAEGDKRSFIQLCTLSFHALRNDFSRLFASSLLVVLPVWVFFTLLRVALYSSSLSELALQDNASALVWNLAFFALETLNVFLSGGLMALLWALTYGRWRNMEAFRNEHSG